MFCFDGSDRSLSELRNGGALLARRAGVVLTVSETAASQLVSGGLGYAAGFTHIADEGDPDAQEEVAARQAADLGVWAASPRPCRTAAIARR